MDESVLLLCTHRVAIHFQKSSLWNPAGAGLPTPTSPDSEKMSTPYSSASAPPPPNSSMGFAQWMAAMPQSHHPGGGGSGGAGSEILSAAAQLMWNGGFEVLEHALGNPDIVFCLTNVGDV